MNLSYNNLTITSRYVSEMLVVCICAFSLRWESPDRSWGDKHLISEVTLSQQATLCQVKLLSWSYSCSLAGLHPRQWDLARCLVTFSCRMVRQRRSVTEAKDEQLHWVDTRCDNHLLEYGDDPLNHLLNFPFCDFITLLKPNHICIELHFLWYHHFSITSALQIMNQTIPKW
jgi:hypothetical protein